MFLDSFFIAHFICNANNEKPTVSLKPPVSDCRQSPNMGLCFFAFLMKERMKYGIIEVKKMG